MSHFYVPYVPLRHSDGGNLALTPITVYYFIYDGSVLTETEDWWFDKDKQHNPAHARHCLIFSDPERMKRVRDSNKVLFHYTEPNRWACVKDRKTGSDTFDYEMTDKEKTFLALAAEPV